MQGTEQMSEIHKVQCTESESTNIYLWGAWQYEWADSVILERELQCMCTATQSIYTRL